jgi:hypothetical protein
VRAARVDDDGARRVVAQGAFDVLAPHGVAGDVDAVDDPARDRPERGDGPVVAAVAAPRHRDLRMVRLDQGVAGLAQRVGALRLGQDRDVLREQVVEVVAMEVRDDAEVDVAHDVLQRDGELDERVRLRVRRVLDRRRRPGGAQHRVDEDATDARLENERRVADQPHA